MTGVPAYSVDMPVAWRAAFAAVLAVFLFALADAHAADAPSAAGSQAHLDEVKRRIRELEKAIADTETSHGKETAELARAERAVTKAKRELLALEKQRGEIEKELARLEAGRAEVETRIEARRVELADWLRRHYMHGGVDLAPLLSAGDPNQLARDMHYLEHLGRARLELIEALRADMAERDALIAASSAQLAKVSELESRQRAARAQLEKEQTQRSRAVAKLAEQLKGHKREVEVLREDEQRLARVMAELARQAAERARLSARRTDAPSNSARMPGEITMRGGAGGRVRGASAQSGKPFAQLRGNLHSPVDGRLTGRFGSPRGEGETTWRGIFITAAGGQEVVAVADGAVVFSDWLRGYGNLIIVDHGDDYLTVYGNNDVLFHDVGDYISAGESLASVGASGGGRETGLYFEIRHRGEPQDPLKWVRLR